VGNFMRGFGGDVELLVAAVDEEVAVGDAGVELEAGGGDGARQSIDESFGVGVGDSAGGVVFHDAVNHGDEVAAEDPVGGGERDVLGGGFEGSAAGVVFGGIVAEEGHGGDVGA